MESLVIGDKKYISSKRAAKILGYTQDYIGQLARSGKISAERVSGIWYVNEDELSRNLVKKDRFFDGLSKQDKNEKTSSIGVQETKKDKSNITLDGIEYISAKRAAELMGYTQDYIGQLCRGKKIESRQIGRGWYIPKSVVYESINKTPEKEQETTQKEVSKIKAFEDIVVFKKDKVVEPSINLKESQPKQQEEKQPQKEEVRAVETIIEPKLKEGLKEEHNKEDYYYPSFLKATYTIDDTPLVPTPKRSREPILHKIVAEEEDNNVNIRISTDTSNAPKTKESTQEFSREHKITKDILKPKGLDKHELVKRSPLSLMNIASVGVAILLLASMVSFVPSTSVFTANTGTLKTIFSFKTPKNEELKAEVISSTSKTSIIEVIVGNIANLLEDRIEYKAK